MTVLDDEPSSPSGARRPLGLAVVALALTSMVIGSVALQSGIVGRASVDPSQLPPPPGACVVLTRSAPVLVDCGMPHHAEITASWWAGEPGAPILDPTRPLLRSAALSATAKRLSPSVPTGPTTPGCRSSPS